MNKNKELILMGEHGHDGVSMYIDEEGILKLEMWWDSECVGDTQTLCNRDMLDVMEMIVKGLRRYQA